MPRAAATNVAQRTVLLLRTSDKQRIKKFASDHNVSSSEIVRRCIQAYESTLDNEQEEFRTLVAEALDVALDSVRDAREQVAENLSQIRKRQAQLP